MCSFPRSSHSSLPAGRVSRLPPGETLIRRGGSSAGPQAAGKSFMFLASPFHPPPALGQGRLISRWPSDHPALSGGPLFTRLQKLLVLSPEKGSPWSPITDPVLEVR